MKSRPQGSLLTENNPQRLSQPHDLPTSTHVASISQRQSGRLGAQHLMQLHARMNRQLPSHSHPSSNGKA